MASDGAVQLTWSRDESALPEVRQRAEAAAAAAAVSNADSTRALEYNRVRSDSALPACATVASIIVASAAQIGKVRACSLYA